METQNWHHLLRMLFHLVVRLKKRLLIGSLRSIEPQLLGGHTVVLVSWIFLCGSW